MKPISGQRHALVAQQCGQCLRDQTRRQALCEIQQGEEQEQAHRRGYGSDGSRQRTIGSGAGVAVIFCSTSSCGATFALVRHRSATCCTTAPCAATRRSNCEPANAGVSTTMTVWAAGPRTLLPSRTLGRGEQLVDRAVTDRSSLVVAADHALHDRLAEAGLARLSQRDASLPAAGALIFAPTGLPSAWLPCE